MLAEGSGSGGAALGLVILVGMYFVPTIVAVIRKVPNIGSVIVINLFLGWSVIGWIVALAMAARSVPQPPQIIIQQSQGEWPHGH
jgi:Superinfection immunity protein